MTQSIQKFLTLPAPERIRILKSLELEERQLLSTFIDEKVDNKYGKWQEDPVGFVQGALEETVWSKQREILESVRDNKRTIVPACHAPGKSHIAARAIAWWVSVHPVGTAQVVTTATTYRQVRNVLWPHVRRVAARHKLPGEVFTVEWKIGNEMVAYGFSAGNHDETAVQGVHAPHLLVVVDEAGGISQLLGTALESLMTGGHTRLLVLGNPPTDQEGSWFERACSSDLYNVIPIGAYDTPNFTGEDAGICKSCPANIPPHPVATHLVDKDWVNDVIREYGDDSAFVEARVHARFPSVVANKVIPLSWIEASADQVVDPGPIRLGVDIAADGGDEFVIAWADGMSCSIRHKSSGKANANAVDVAGVILAQILAAEKVHRERQIQEPVRVKIDSIGVGWGVASVLKTWASEQRHNSKIVAVNVAERARDSNRFTNQRAEMWWNARNLLQPKDTEGIQDIKLDIDHRCAAQMTGPTYASDSSGRIKIESKADMRRRGIPSPDRAEAILLCLYDPPGSVVFDMTSPVSITQPNPWGGLGTNI